DKKGFRTVSSRRPFARSTCLAPARNHADPAIPFDIGLLHFGNIVDALFAQLRDQFLPGDQLALHISPQHAPVLNKQRWIAGTW
ncbi:MAG TPA: hypothetical protein VFT99_13195, partial [Roseiflexaceae bacterium]|nr:hypothetical protein [Roseiflexaceae bacterium]